MSAYLPPKRMKEADCFSLTIGRIDRFVQWLRWPLAVSAAVVTPLLIWSLIRLSGSIVANPSLSLLPFALGVLGFLIIWHRWLSSGRLGSLLITLEHELTHATFAVLTGHSLLSFRAALGRGAEMRFSGRGNWMITAAPYFFPTAAIVLLVFSYLLPFGSLPWQSLMLGVALAYHVVSTWREIDRDRIDLKLLGPVFCWMFLPAANLAVLGLMISFAYSGGNGVFVWLSHILEPIYNAVAYSWGSIHDRF